MSRDWTARIVLCSACLWVLVSAHRQESARGEGTGTTGTPARRRCAVTLSPDGVGASAYGWYGHRGRRLWREWKGHDMPSIDEQRTSEEAVFKAITSLAQSAEDFSGTTRSTMVRDAAIAWRAMRGGQQPGSVVVETR